MGIIKSTIHSLVRVFSIIKIMDLTGSASEGCLYVLSLET